MSLPRECNLQDSRGSIYSSSQPNPTSGIEYESGGIFCADRSTSTIADDNDNIGSNPMATTTNLIGCQESGSLFSVHSAPPVPLAELGIIQNDNPIHGFGCQRPGFAGLKETNSATSTITTHTDLGIYGPRRKSFITESDDIIGNTIVNSGIERQPTGNVTPKRPGSLKINSLPPPTTTSKTLHATFLQHQISEIEEDDNENLLTVSSITARPLIAKSREIRTSRLLAEKEKKEQQKKRKRNNNAPSSASSSASYEPPDGGYGWFIVFGAFSVQFWVAGLVKSYGVLYVEIMETFPKTSASVASWIPAILSALCLALAPLSSALCQKYSCRVVVFIGGLFCAFGMTLSYFATDLLHLLFTFGILTGIGGGLSTTPGVVIVSQYFDKHRALANGITVSGTAAGSFILPVLIKHLVDNFGFHGTILILGGCMLHVCLSATLYRPLEIKEEEEEETPRVNILGSTEITKSLTDLTTGSAYGGLLTGSTYLNSADDLPDPKFIEHLFLEETKNRINDYYNTNKFINNAEKTSQLGDISDDEGKDIVGETTFMRPIKSGCSSTILHSVEDLSTDSTCVYRKRSGTDSNRGSRRRKYNISTDEIISKMNENNDKSQTPMISSVPPISNTNKGLSKSMEIPTPSSFYEEGSFDEEIQEAKTCCDRIQEYLDISLLKDTTFILMCLSVTLMSVGCPYMLYYLPAHVISIGYSKSEGGYLVAVSAALDLIGRLGLGWLSDLQLFDRKKTYIICIIGAGIAVLTIPSVNSFYVMGLLLATYGLCLGCWYLLMPVLLADLFGTDRISSSYGLVRMFQSIGAISVPPLAGFLRDLSGNYKICFYCMGSCMVCGCIPLLVYAVMKRRKKKYSFRCESENNSIS
ncbi:monocarboxylate transporter 12 [Condylostylus longicornis]|uniref:monocarboxylate transporter 12 n=1 Tax=Condylostylus longicornis TaxID=2530218 RepID=UPI00244DD567|nr:monocarboxylate transporter 12 [Condylostylus longicornis]